MKDKFEIETCQNLGNSIAELLRMKFSDNRIITSWGRKSPEGLGRAVLSLVHEVVGKEITVGKEVYMVIEKCGTIEDEQVFSSPEKRMAHVDSLMKEYSREYGREVTLENIDTVTVGKVFIELKTMEIQ